MLCTLLDIENYFCAYCIVKLLGPNTFFGSENDHNHKIMNSKLLFLSIVSYVSSLKNFLEFCKFIYTVILLSNLKIDFK